MEDFRHVKDFFHPIVSKGVRRVALGYGAGMTLARMQTGVRLKRTVSQELMAKLVTNELHRMGFTDKTVSQSVWSDYEKEASEPSLIVIRATSRVSGIPESDVAGMQSTLNIDASKVRYLTDEEIGRAYKKVAEDPTLSARVTGKGARKRRA